MYVTCINVVEGEEGAEGEEGEEGDDGACVRMWCVMVASFIFLQHAILFNCSTFLCNR